MEAINVIEAKKLIDEKLETQIILIDVRTPSEYKSSHIKGSRLLPLDKITQWSDSLDKNKTYLIQCRTGGRSSIAQQFLHNKGYNTINMVGEIVDWIEEGFDVETE